MGCKSSKAASAVHESVATPVAHGNHKHHHQIAGGVVEGSRTNIISTSLTKSRSDEEVLNSKIRPDKPERLYKLLAKALDTPNDEERYSIYEKILDHCHQEPLAAKWKNPMTGSTPLHLACRLVDMDTSQHLYHVIDTLIACHANALRDVDVGQNIPLHYAIAPTTHFQHLWQNRNKNNTNDKYNPQASTKLTVGRYYASINWRERAILIERIIQGDPRSATLYLERNDVVFESGDATGGCSPLYRVLQTLPDDFDPQAPTLEYTAVVQAAYPDNAGRGNSSDGDKPLSLLYRRFTRQFDISEQFFDGDNSRAEVVSHRQRYKTAAGNTWKLIELLLRPPNLPPSAPWGIVHRAVQVETPPDLLRYIVETNAQDLTRVDPHGNLPLHYAAASKPPSLHKHKPTPSHDQESANGTDNGQHHNHQGVDHFPAFYTKYVMDELLYKFPEAASMADAQGRYPLTLAIESGKQWIGGGIKSLHDAYPEAVQQINLDEHPALIRALSMTGDDDDAEDDDDDYDYDEDDETKQHRMKESKGDFLSGIVKDKQHDAIMLVQQPNVTAEEVATSMWAHEEDAGVQMLGCVAIAKMLTGQAPVDVLRIALIATAAVVNAMKAHPNEIIVQEKASLALQLLAIADGQREVSMVASGAVAAIVGAMQAHVGDAGVQEQACLAVAAIVSQGGADRATVVASVSGVTAILNALAAHAAVLGVQIAGLNALAALTQHPNANLPDLPRTQTEPLLLAAQDAFPAECSELVSILLQRMSST